MDSQITGKIKELQDEFAVLLKSERGRYDKRFGAMDITLAELNRALARAKSPNVMVFPAAMEHTEEDLAFSSWIRKGVLGPPEQKVLTVGSDPSFGFACPPQLSSEILHSLTEGSPMRGVAREYQTDKNSLQILKKSASGVVVLQSSEIGEILETSGLAYAKLEFFPKTEVYLLKQSVLHAEDSAFAMESEIALELGEAFGTYEANAHINGTEGVIANVGDGTLNTYPEMHAGSTSVITGDNIINLTYNIPTRFLANAKFILNRATMAYIRTIKDGVTGAFLWQPSLLGGEGARGRETLCGYPVVLNDNMPSIGSANYVVGFGDWSKAFAIVDHSPGFTIQRMAEAFAIYQIIGFLASFRTTSGPLDGAAATFLQMSA